MKKIILFSLMFFSAIYSIGQQITFKDKQTGEPLQDVSLFNSRPTTVEVTDANGNVNIKAFEGAERIQVILYGYEKLIFSYEELAKLSVVELEQVPFSLDAIVISASKWNQNLRDIPNKMIRISPLDVKLNNPQTAADMLANSGYVAVQKSQLGGGSPMIRGFATNRLLYSVDGVRMNTAIFRGGNIQNVISLDAFSIEQTEILFGAGSVMYGSDAIGAVMSFQTLTPKFSKMDEPLVSGNAVTRYATASNEKTAHFDINVGWKKWASLTSFTASDFGDLKMGSYGPTEYLRPFYVQRQDSVDVVVQNNDPKVQTPSGYSQMNLMQKIAFKPSEKWQFDYAFHYSETSEYARYDRHIRYKNGLPRYGEWSYGPQKWAMNNLSVTHSGNNAVYDHMNLRIAYQNFEESRISRDFNKSNRETRTEKVAAYSANLDFEKAIGKKNHLFYGVEFVQNDVTSTGLDENITTGSIAKGASRYPQSTWASVGAYVNDQFKVNDKLLLQGGVRYSTYQLDARFDTTFYPFPFTKANINNGALTGSLGLVYRPTDKWVIGFNASTAFRSPNVDDVGKVFDSSPGSVVVPNPSLSSEYAYNVDLGITKIFGKVAKIDVTGYYTILQNALVRRNFTLNGADSIVYDGELSQVQAIQNASVATVYGIQAGVEFNLTNGFKFANYFNYQLGEEELDDGTISPSRHAAPMFGSSRISYTQNKLKLLLSMTYSGQKTFEQLPVEEQGKDYIYAIDKNGDPYSPAWYTLDFKALYQFTNHFSVSAGVENLTDQRYKTYSSGIAAPGRNLILSLRANF